MGGLSPAPGPCLTEAQLSELRDAAPGPVPEALARHLASCPRCQERALFGARPPGKRRPMPAPPSLRRAAFLAALVLAAMAFFFWSLAKLTGRIQ
jgi:hypothetical protein